MNSIYYRSTILYIVYISYVYMCVLVAQSCPTLCDPMDYSPPGSSVHGILQARILEWVAISFFIVYMSVYNGDLVPIIQQKVG